MSQLEKKSDTTVSDTPIDAVFREKWLFSSVSKRHLTKLLSAVEDELATCTICKQLMLSPPLSSSPKVLPCRHTFCQDCLLHLSQVSTQISCPTCRNKSTLPTGGVPALPNNLEVIRLADLMSRNSQPSHCTKCAGKPLSFVCVECDVFHNNNSQNRTTAQQKPDVKRTHDFHFTGAPKHCAQHPEELIRFYCEKCEQQLCRDCATQDHRTHNYVPIKEALAKYRPVAQSLLDQVQSKVEGVQTSMTSVVNTLDQLDQSSKQLKQRIHKETQAIIAAAQERAERLSRQIDAIRNPKRFQLTQQLELLEIIRDGMQSSCDLVSKLLAVPVESKDKDTDSKDKDADSSCAKDVESELLSSKRKIIRRLRELNNESIYADTHIASSVTVLSAFRETSLQNTNNLSEVKAQLERTAQDQVTKIIENLRESSVVADWDEHKYIPDAKQCRLENVGEVLANELCVIRLDCYNSSGLPLQRNYVPALEQLVAPTAIVRQLSDNKEIEAKIEAAEMENGNVSYNISFIPTQIGQVGVHVRIAAQYVTAQPSLITVKPHPSNHKIFDSAACGHGITLQPHSNIATRNAQEFGDRGVLVKNASLSSSSSSSSSSSLPIRFKLLTHPHQIYIGLALRSRFNAEADDNVKNAGWYLDCANGSLWSSHAHGLPYHNCTSSPIHEGSIVELTYHPDKKTISFNIDGISSGVAFVNIDTPPQDLAPVVVMWRDGASVQLLP